MVNFIMTNSIQKNASTLIFKVNAGTPGIKRDSMVNENLSRNEDLLRNEVLLRNLLENLNNLNNELTKLDGLVERKLMEK